MLHDFTFKLYFIYISRKCYKLKASVNTLLNRCHCYLNFECREFQLILQMIAMEINYSSDVPVMGKKNYILQKPFKTDFLTLIGNAKLRPSFVIC